MQKSKKNRKQQEDLKKLKADTTYFQKLPGHRIFSLRMKKMWDWPKTPLLTTYNITI